jgi:hypothetical protein
VTCGHGRRWTSCLLFCKQGQGFESLSSTGQTYNSNSGTESTAAMYSNRDPRQMPHTSSSGLGPPGGCGLRRTDLRVLGRDPGR